MVTQVEGYLALAKVVPEKCDKDGDDLSKEIADGEDLDCEIKNPQCQGQAAHGDQRKEKKLAEILPVRIPEIEVFVQEKTGNHPAGIRDSRRPDIPDTEIFSKKIQETHIDQGRDHTDEKKTENLFPANNGRDFTQDPVFTHTAHNR
jgi:hypothetical protein